jgi:AraC family transcriptional regulator
MITLEKFNAVLDYVEENILEEIDVNHLASIAACSAYDFQRTFAFAAGMSIAEYIRKRRLTLAGAELQQDNSIRVIDAALKYGYDSPVSFARTFQAFHGVKPSEAKKPDVILKTFPRRKFQIYMKEVNEVRIIEKEEMFLSGFLVEATGGNLWAKYERETEIYEQPELIDWTAHEVRFYTKDGEQVFTACRQKENVTSPHYDTLVVPALTWAVFDIDHTIAQEPQYDAVDKWLDENKNSYKQMQWDGGGRVSKSEFVICWYDHDNKFKKDRIMELWVPIEKAGKNNV